MKALKENKGCFFVLPNVSGMFSSTNVKNTTSEKQIKTMISTSFFCFFSLISLKANENIKNSNDSSDII
jgi:hypothetical protein